jgi:hypothetical protein
MKGRQTVKKLMLGLFLLLTSVAGYAQTQECSFPWIKLWANPGEGLGITVFCTQGSADIWAMAIYGTAKDWNDGNRKIAVAYVPDHTFVGYLKIQTNTVGEICNSDNHCLFVDFGQDGEDPDGTEWVWITGYGTE